MTLRSIIHGATALALALVFTACESDPGPTGVPQPAPRTVTVNGVDLLVVPGGLKIASQTVVQKIGPHGGSISVDGGRLDVPSGALVQEVSISMKGRETDQFRYKFGPSGLTFDTAATLTIQVDPEALGVDPARLAIAGASDEGNDWTVIGGAYDESLGAVVVPIEHFSLYAICLD
ncbi:MAG: hypothetical protein KY397_00615 [Gemmatimonadetes bacterium]|nr:hypothetical protein [Gemmatimonadota bacterium]